MIMDMIERINSEFSEHYGRGGALYAAPGRIR